MTEQAMTSESKQTHDLLELKRKRDVLMRDAEQAAYAYFCECELGTEREKAHDIYTNIRTAGRVY